MSEHGATLQTYNQELVKCLEELKNKRSELQEIINREETEKHTLEKNLEAIQEKLSVVNGNLKQHKYLRDSYDKTIEDTELGFKKVYIEDTAPQQTNDIICTKESKLEPVMTGSSDNLEIAPSYAQQEIKTECSQGFVIAKEQPQKSQFQAFAINASGELDNITSLIDFESIGLVQIQQPIIKQELENNTHEEDVDSFNVSDENFSQVKVEVEVESINWGPQIIANPVPIGDISLPLRNTSSDPNTKALQTQKIVEDCYYMIQIEQQQDEQNLEVKPPVTNLNMNSTENISIPQLTKRESPKGSNTLECNTCKKSFKRRSNYNQHFRSQRCNRLFCCGHCTKSFMRKEHLMRHLATHNGKKLFTCDICDRPFSRNDNLLKHRKTHGRETNFECEICDKHFMMKHYYEAHKLTHDETYVKPTQHQH